MCRKKSRSSSKSGSHEQRQVKTDYVVQTVDYQEEPAEANLGGMYIYSCAVQRERPIFVKVDINSIPTEMEVDTGASLTVMGEKKFHKIFKDCKQSWKVQILNCKQTLENSSLHIRDKCYLYMRISLCHYPKLQEEVQYCLDVIG